MIFSTESKKVLKLLSVFSIFLLSISCSQKEVEPDPNYSPPSIEETTKVLNEKAPSEVSDSQTSYQARKTIQEKRKDFISFNSELKNEIDPDQKFSLGLDRMVRDDYSILDHQRICVVTNRLAYDQNGLHLLETLLPLDRPIVSRIIFFRDELPTPARSTDIDRIMGGYPGVRVFERNYESIQLIDSMLDDTDVVLIDLPYRGSRIFPESAFMAEVISDASIRNLPVVVLDRPIPMSANLVDGPVGDPKFHSSVQAYFPTYVVPGYTLGELARHYNGFFGLGANLEVITMTQWNRVDGFFPLLEFMENMETVIPEEISEWDHYVSEDFRSTEFQIVKKMLPEDSVVEIQKDNGTTTLLLNTKEKSAEDFLNLIKLYEPERYNFSKVDDNTISVSSEFPVLPASLSLSIWACYSKNNLEILPESDSKNTYGFGTMNWVQWLRDGRDPREIKRLWTQNPMNEKLQESRVKDLLYD